MGHRDTLELRAKWDQAQFNGLPGWMNRCDFVMRHTLSHIGRHTTIVRTAYLDHLHATVTAPQAGPLMPKLYEQVKQRMDEWIYKGRLISI